MYAFAFHRPATVRQAANLAARTEDFKFLAGGHTLLPTMKQRLASPANIIDLGQVAELRGIERFSRSVAIGAMVTHAEVTQSAEVRGAIPGLVELVELVGDPHVRHRGTIGGSIANNDPAADYPAACIALGATIVTNKRKIPAADFFTGLFSTALEETEIVTKVIFPIPQRAGYAKFRNPASRYALVGVFVARRAGEAIVAVTGAGSNGVFRWKEAEEALNTRFSPKYLEGITISPNGLNSDIHADAAYRAHLIGVMARRAVASAISR